MILSIPRSRAPCPKDSACYSLTSCSPFSSKRSFKECQVCSTRGAPERCCSVDTSETCRYSRNSTGTSVLLLSLLPGLLVPGLVLAAGGCSHPSPAGTAQGSPPSQELQLPPARARYKVYFRWPPLSLHSTSKVLFSQQGSSCCGLENDPVISSLADWF